MKNPRGTSTPRGFSIFPLIDFKNKILDIKNFCVIYAVKQNTGNLTVRVKRASNFLSVSNIDRKNFFRENFILKQPCYFSCFININHFSSRYFRKSRHINYISCHSNNKSCSGSYFYFIYSYFKSSRSSKKCCIVRK